MDSLDSELDSRRLFAILERANRIASMTSLDDLLSQMLDLMIDISGATKGTLYLLDSHARELLFKVVRGDHYDLRLQGNRIKDDMGIVGYAVQHRQPIVIHDLASDPRWYRDFNPDLASRLVNAITLPLMMQGNPIGAVQIFNFERADIELLLALGNRMASEVDKLMLLEKTWRSNQRFQTLVNVLGQIGAVLDREELLSLLVKSAASLLDSDGSSVVLTDGNGEQGIPPLSKSYKRDSAQNTDGPLVTNDENPKDSVSFLAASTISVPLHARPIILGQEHNYLDERAIGNLKAFNQSSGVFDSEDTQILEILASQASTVLQIGTLYGQANGLFLDFIMALASAIDAKDPYTRGHSIRVSSLSIAIAKELGIQGDLLHDIRIGSLLHDIGKIGIPDHVLMKNEQLTSEEYELVKRHPIIGYNIMDQVKLIRNSLPAILEHHERLDGSGYPHGLRGDQISIIGRVVAVADVFDALITDRPYRDALDLESALDYLHAQIGIQFDETCVHSLMSWVFRTGYRHASQR
jgi:HD-GYP domain-containing protein (c-di-GMP phosphodiesterase class II)